MIDAAERERHRQALAKQWAQSWLESLTYESSRGNGERGLMAHHVEQFTPKLVDLLEKWGALCANEALDELILRHRCGCEVCAHTSELCPASASSIAMERISSERARDSEFSWVVDKLKDMGKWDIAVGLQHRRALKAEG